MMKKIQGWQISYRNPRDYHLHKSIPFTEKRSRKPETGIKNGFDKAKHES